MKPNPSNQAPPIEAVESLDNGEHSAIDITAVDKNLWQVSTSFSPKDNNKEAIPLKLREIKQKISQQFNHPEKLLKYRHLKKKQVMEDGQLYVKFEIERIPIPEGPPTLSFGAMISDNGEEYADMICMIDLFPLDESGKQLNSDTVRYLLKQKQITEKLVQWSDLDNIIHRVRDTLIPMHNIEIARGKLPSKGKDAELQFTFPLHPKQGMTDEYLEARKVKSGDVLCTKTPPTMGSQSGFSVMGKKLPPLEGWDVTLIAENGACLSMDQTQINSEQNGLVTATREEKSIIVPQGRKIIPLSITFQVEPLMILSGKKPEVVTTDDPIEVTGSLKENSHLISRNEIHVKGNVQKGSHLQASRDIMIGGNINQGTLICDGAIISKGKISGSTINAKGNITLSGSVDQSLIQGSDIDIHEVKGSEIQAKNRVTVGKIGASREGRISEVNIGRNNFLNDKIKQHQSFVRSASQSLTRLQKLFGEQNLEHMDTASSKRILMKLLNQRKSSGKKPYTTSEVEALKQLLGSVSTLKNLIQEKQNQIQLLEHQLSESDDATKLFIVKERVTAKTVVTIDNHRTELEPSDTGICIRSDQSGISVDSLPADLTSIESLLEAFEEKDQDSAPAHSSIAATNGDESDSSEENLAQSITGTNSLEH